MRNLRIACDYPALLSGDKERSLDLYGVVGVAHGEGNLGVEFCPPFVSMEAFITDQVWWMRLDREVMAVNVLGKAPTMVFFEVLDKVKEGLGDGC